MNDADASREQGLDAASVELIARRLLGLVLPEGLAARLLPALRLTQSLARNIEDVPLPYAPPTFVTPRTGELWLEQWPE